MTDLGEGAATAINDAGQIVGTVSFTEARSNGYTTATHAALWNVGKRQDFGSLPAGHSAPQRRLILRAQSSATATMAWNRNRVKRSCGGPDRYEIWGQAAPWRSTQAGRSPASAADAVLWQRGGLCDLNTCLRGAPGWVLTSASGINNRGQISGSEPATAKAVPFCERRPSLGRRKPVYHGKRPRCI